MVGAQQSHHPLLTSVIILTIIVSFIGHVNACVAGLQQQDCYAGFPCSYHMDCISGQCDGQLSGDCETGCIGGLCLAAQVTHSYFFRSLYPI
jgi:hypothetical protein